MIVAACAPKTRFNPQAVEQSARTKLKRGEVAPALDEALRGLQHYPSEETEWHWHFRVLEAEALARQGSFRESLQLLRPDPPAFLLDGEVAVRRRLIQGVASARLQDPADATRFESQAETLARTKCPHLLGEVLLAKGVVKFLFGDSTGASDAYSEALHVGRKQQDPFTEATALSGLGVIATKVEHYDESIDLDESAVALARSIGSENTLAPTLGNMAWCYRRLGDFENALSLYKQAEDVSARRGLVVLQLSWLAGLSGVYYEKRDYGLAEDALMHGIGLVRKQGNKRTLIQYLNALSEIALETGRVDEGHKYLAEALAIEQGPAGSGLDRSDLLASKIVGARIDQAEHHYVQAEKSFREVIKDPKADTAQKWEAEARLARVYADIGLSGKADAEFRRSVALVEAARSSVQTEDLRLSFLSSAITFYDDYIDFLISHQRAEDALNVAELSRARTMEEGLSLTARSASSSQKAVRPQRIARKLKATLLFYWIGHNHSYLWLVTPTKTAHFELPKASEIDPLVKSYRKALVEGRVVLADSSLDGQKLYSMLVEPAKKLIHPGSRVIALPAESLYGVNFETLIVPDPRPHFWIEDVTLTTASSLTLLASSAARPAASRRSLLVVGNTEAHNPDFPALPQAPMEMTKIESYFSGEQSKVLEGKQATPSAYLSSNPERFSYLHFVTHGTASHTRPLESAVILSQEGDSYKLYARDIVTHHLNANLVTISACNGSGTRSYSGEGLVGLSWAFLRAGAHNVIAALWEVSDASTPQMMDALYGELTEGKDPASALRDAKLKMLHSADANSVFRKPFYWAPFQLYAGS